MGVLDKRERRIARHFGGGAWALAADEIREALAEEGEDAHLAHQLAYCHYRQRAMDEALAACDRALAQDAQHFEALRLRAQVLVEQERHDEAVTYVRRALANRREPMPRVPGGLAKVFRLLDLAPKWKWKGKGRMAEQFARQPDALYERWCDWGERYIAWYEGRQGPKGSA